MEDETFEFNDSPNIEDENHEDGSQGLSAEELQQRNQSLYEQLKKAKGFVRDENGDWVKKPQPKVEDKKPEAPRKSEEFGSRDMFALVKAGVHEDDIDEVAKVAKLENISISEALKLDLTQTILAKRTEYRKSAEVANASPARRGAQKPSGEALLKQLSDGNIPDRGSETADDLFWARRGGKR